MCSVVGYVGKNFSRTFVFEGLSRLEYRGYDSAGFACLDVATQSMRYVKAEGQLSNLLEHQDFASLDGHIAIGHTRWSTHGKATLLNAHPHVDCKQRISVVHNGIIENHTELRDQLRLQQHQFYSETDTEVIAHMLEHAFAHHATDRDAVCAVVQRLHGAYAFIALAQDRPDSMLLVRKRSPLCIGIGHDEMFVASDTFAFADKTNRVLFMPDESFAFVSAREIQLYDFAGNHLEVAPQMVETVWAEHTKQGHEHYMLKEIYEQKKAIHATVRHLQSLGDTVWRTLGLTAADVHALRKIILMGCGTSWHAARIGQFFFEYCAQLPTQVYLASEMRYMPYFHTDHSLLLAISQSGETADTLEAMRRLTDQRIAIVALSNVASSTMVREADGVLLTKAGHEVAVASTKAFSTQLSALYWLAHRIALEQGRINHVQMEQAEYDLLCAAEQLEQNIDLYKHVIDQRLAAYFAQYTRFIFLGRHIGYPFALEAMLKLKEISYIFAQCYPAGELKHGPLALVDAQTPVCIFSSMDEQIYQKLLANVQEAKARGGHIIAFAFAGQDELCQLADTLFVVPKTQPLLEPLVMTGLMQYFAYAIAKKLGREIDRPRNLAKSVTVE
jgi:glucosamine--fructose-6-phosphate aminotransferase (isomerizing)